MTPIAIPSDVRAAIYAHARAAFPDECCGYLVGAAAGAPSAAPAGAADGAADEAAVDAAIACRNAQADGEHPIAPERGADTGFVIGGAELLRFARSFDTDRPARIIYHSHTNGRAYLSDVDRRMAAGAAGPAYPVQHVVIGVTAAAVTEAAQFAWSDAAGDYVEVARWTCEAA
jgi:proteasome lid subunit RPN8/RPN11